MAFSPLGNSDHLFVSVSIDFPSDSQQDVPFHRIAYDYSCADRDGLHDHSRDVPQEDIFKLSASAADSFIYLFFNWVSLHARLNSHYEHGDTRKRNTKRLKHTGNQFRKNLQLKDIC